MLPRVPDLRMLMLTGTDELSFAHIFHLNQINRLKPEKCHIYFKAHSSMRMNGHRTSKANA